MELVSFPKPKLHFFICINDRTNLSHKPSCGPRIKPDDVSEIKRWIAEQGLASQIYCTKAQCLGFCNPEGSVAVIYPEGKFVKGIQTKEDLRQLIQQEWESQHP